MEIRCVNGCFRRRELTVGKVYNVLEKKKFPDGFCYKILNDKEEERWYVVKRFEIVEDKCSH